eukprot:468914-Hanusia_phi.AAC.6
MEHSSITLIPPFARSATRPTAMAISTREPTNASLLWQVQRNLCEALLRGFTFLSFCSECERRGNACPPLLSPSASRRILPPVAPPPPCPVPAQNSTNYPYPNSPIGNHLPTLTLTRESFKVSHPVPATGRAAGARARRGQLNAEESRENVTTPGHRGDAVTGLRDLKPQPLAADSELCQCPAARRCLSELGNLTQ